MTIPKLKAFIQKASFQQYLTKKKKREKQFLRLSKGAVDFHFREVAKPLRVSFDHLTLQLKVCWVLPAAS